MPNEPSTPNDSLGMQQDEFNLTALVQQASNDLDTACQTRHEVGQEKYGTFTYFENDTIAMAMEEIADMMNYMRYTWIKLWLMQRAVAKKANEHPASEGGWVPLKEL